MLDVEEVPISTESLDYFDLKQIGPLRAALKPLEIKQPEGANFTLQGNEVRWQKWSLRHSFHPREGLVLYTVAYDEGGRKPRSSKTSETVSTRRNWCPKVRCRPTPIATPSCCTSACCGGKSGVGSSFWGEIRGEIRCQFIILARKDEPTPDFP